MNTTKRIFANKNNEREFNKRWKELGVDEMSPICQQIAEELLSNRADFQFDSANSIFTTSMRGFEESVTGTPVLYISVEENEEVLRVVVSSNVMTEVIACSGENLEMEVLPELAYFAFTSSPFRNDERIHFQHGLECDEDFVGPCVEMTIDKNVMDEGVGWVSEYVFEYVDMFEQIWSQCIYMYRRNSCLREEFKGKPILAACGLDSRTEKTNPTKKRKEGRVYH